MNCRPADAFVTRVIVYSTLPNDDAVCDRRGPAAAAAPCWPAADRAAVVRGPLGEVIQALRASP